MSPGVWQNLTPGTSTTLRVGYGLGQWTNTNGDTHGRLYQLLTWLSDNGYGSDDGNGQLAYLIHENVWYTSSDYPFANLQEFLNSDSTDITMLTHAFNLCWEGVHESSWDDRVTFANQCYAYIVEHYNDTVITTWYNPNAHLTITQRLNNAVLLYRYLSNDSPPQPSPTKKKMPVWMMINYHI